MEILKETNWLKDMQKKFAEARKQLKADLENIKGVQVYPSSTNFFLCEFEKPRDLVYEELLKRGILTRRLSDEVLKNTLRFCIGNTVKNDFLISCLREILN